MFKAFTSAISFLTIIPSHNDDLDSVAKHMYLFPVVGAIIGIIIGSIGFGLSFVISPLIIGLILTGSIAIITGIHHTDALGDFADGLMVKGTKEKKMQVMRDPQVGSAGVITIVLYAVGMIIAISMMKTIALFEAIILSELMAKLSMVILANRGNSAWDGLSTPFTRYMKDPKKIILAGVLAIAPTVIFGGMTGVYVVLSSIGLSLLLLVISKRSFGGVSGDVFGASNEIVRLASLLIFASA